MKTHKHITALVVCAFASWMVGAQTTTSKKVEVMLKNEESVNTKGLEFSPAFYEDGIVLISTNNAGLDKVTDEKINLLAMSILRSRRSADGSLSKPEPFAKELSSLFHEGPVSFDRTAETIFFTRNKMVNGKEKLTKDEDHKMSVYASKKSGNVWTEPQMLPFNSEEYEDCHPSISIDGDKLYFASNRPGGYGGMDLYVSYRVEDSWSDPVNLGETINTKGNEVFPFIHADGTLYFACNQRGGQGGLDLFYAVPQGTEWVKPVNMGKPFNTKGDDFSLIVDLDKINGYFASNGQGGQGGDEILSFHVENGNLDDFLLQNGNVADRNLDFLVQAVDKSTGIAVPGAEVRIINLDASDVIGRDEQGNLIAIQKVNGQDVMVSVPPGSGSSGVTDRKGRFQTTVKPGAYVCIVSKDGYQPKQVQANINKPDNKITAELEKVTGKVYWDATVFNYLTNAPLAGATALVINRSDGRKDTIISDDNGKFHYYLEPNTKYKVDMYQGGRFIGTTDVDAGPANGEPLVQNISVAPLLPGTVIELPNIYYNYNDATLRPDARKDLELLVSLMRQHEAVTVELASHTDSRGSAYYNQELSQRRANGVADYLANRGIARTRLIPVGYGENQPRNGCRDGIPCPEQDHSRNRRTEVRIVTGVNAGSLVYVDGQIPGPNDGGNVNQAPVAVAPPPQKVKVVNGSSAEFYVVAGSFLTEANARNQARTLQSAGYATVEVIQFPNSKFFSVCVNRFNNRQEAEELERRLENNDKIDAFVRAAPKGK